MQCQVPMERDHIWHGVVSKIACSTQPLGSALLLYHASGWPHATELIKQSKT